jgi:hypothetical protein
LGSLEKRSVKSNKSLNNHSKALKNEKTHCSLTVQIARVSNGHLQTFGRHNEDKDESYNKLGRLAV